MSLELPRKKRNWRKLNWTCHFEFVDKDGSVKKGNGRTMNVDGVIIELFPSSVLCAMLHRQLKTLYGWERDFNFPRALWKVRDDAITNRWYSKKQLIGIRAAYEHFGCLKGKEHRHKIHQFISAVRTFFHIIDMPKEIRHNGRPAEGLRLTHDL